MYERHQAILAFATEGQSKLIRDIEQVSKALRDMVSTQGRTVDLFPGIRPETLRQIQTTVPGYYNRVLELQSQVIRRERELQQVMKRAAVPIGGRRGDVRGFASEFERDQAQLRAGENLSRANRQLADALDRIRREAEKQLTAEQAVSAAARRKAQVAEQVNRHYERFMQRQLRDQERSADAIYNAQIRQAQAANRKAVEDEKRLNEARIRAKREDAIWAFSQLPTRAALTQDEIEGILSLPARQSGDTDLIYRRRIEAADAAQRLAIAESRLATAVDAAARGEGTHAQLTERLRQSVIARDSAQRALTAAEERLAVAQRNAEITISQGQRTSLREDFLTGFRGRQGDFSYAMQAGQAAKFTLLYGTAYNIMFSFTRTLRATLNEGIQFQDSLVNLRIASGRNEEELQRLANELSKASVAAGFAPSQAVEIGARAIGLYGATTGSLAEQERVARISAEVVSRLAVGSEKSPVDLQGDIAAITQAMGLGAAGQLLIEDLDAYFTKRFGVRQGSTLQVVAQSATVGRAAGFSNEELFAIAAQIMSRTGQEAPVATWMAQIFSRAGEGSLTALTQRYGIDPNQELAKIFNELAKIYQERPQERDDIAAAFGRGRVQNAVVTLLQEWEDIQRLVGNAQAGDARGAGLEQFQERMRNIGGQLRQMQGQLVDFASQLGESGLLDIIGLGVKAFSELLETTNNLLRLWNQLPDAIQQILIAAAAVGVASRTGLLAAGADRFMGAMLGRSGLQLGRAVSPTSRARTFAVSSSGEAEIIANAGRRTVTNAAGETVALASMAGFRTVGMAAVRMLGPIGLAITGLEALASLKASSDRMRVAQESATAALAQTSSLAPGSTSGDFSAAAAEFGNAARANREATGWLMQALSLGTADDNNVRLAEILERNAAYFQRIAERMGAQEENLTLEGLFADLTPDGLRSAFENLEASGASASTQLRLLREAIAALGDESQSAASRVTRFDPTVLSAQLAAGWVEALRDPIGELGFEIPRPAIDQYVGKNKGQPFVRTDVDPNMVLQRLGIDVESIGTRIEQQLNALGITNAGQLTPEVIDEVSQRVTDQIDFGKFYANPETASEAQRRFTEAARQFLTDAISEQFSALAGATVLPPDSTQTLIENAIRQSRERISSIPAADTASRLAEMRQRLQDVQQILASGSTNEFNEQAVMQAVAEVRRDLVQAQLDHLEGLRRVALRNARSEQQAIAASRSSITRQIRAVVQGGGDADQLADIVGSAGQWAVQIARETIEGALAIARAAQLALAGMAAASIFNVGAVQQLMAQYANTSAEIDRLQGMLNALDVTASGTVQGEISGWGGGSSGGAQGPTAAQIAAARAQAYAQRNAGGIAAARAAIQSARADMAAAERGSMEYYNALGQLFSAQVQLADAIRAHQRNLLLLRIDATNPLQLAQVELQMARRKLREDLQAGRGADVIAEDRVALQAAQASLEQTKFEQRLQAVQTAEELGRISHQKYMSYLENEKKRLEAIKNRTYQQQQQLDQIDRLMLEATRSMQGQWNFGDIQLPTPYEVRRYIEQRTRAAMGSPVPGSSSSVMDARSYVFRIDGADVAMVRRIIQDVVGTRLQVRTTTTRKTP